MNDPVGNSDKTPDVGPLTSVVTVVPTVGGEAPLQPMSFVTTEFTRIELITMVKASLVALGQGRGTGLVVGLVVAAAVVAREVLAVVATGVVVVVGCSTVVDVVTGSQPGPQHTS